MKDYYRILEVSPDAAQDMITEQYHFLLHAWHPDKFPSPDQKAKAQERTKEINEAYEALSDSSKRTAYDQQYKQANAQAETASSTGAISKIATNCVAILSREEAIHWLSRFVRLGLATTSFELIQRINTQITKWNHPALYESDEAEIFGSRVYVGTTSKNLLKAVFLDQKRPEVWAIRVLNPAGEVTRGTWEGHMLMTNKRIISYSSGSKDEQQGVKIHQSLDSLVQMEVEGSIFRFLTRKGNRVEIGFNLPRVSIGTYLESNDDDYSRRQPDIARERGRQLDDVTHDLKSALFALFNEMCARARVLP